MAKISILVPVYNVEKYLKQCLDSILAQTLTDFEIIAINDGSTDHSTDILRKYAEKHPQIRLIEKENTGYGDSMNQGIKAAKGEYIGIVEPDDFIDNGMFECLVALADEHGADIVKENYYLHSSGKDTLNPRFSKIGDDIFYQPPAIWSAIYRRRFLLKNKIDFLPTPGASYQDTSFNFKALACAVNNYDSAEASPKLIISNTAHLHYRTDNESSSVNSPEKIFCVASEFAEVENYLESRDLDPRFLKVAQAAKYGAYHWNLLRLPNESVKKFVPVMRTEFLASKKRGLIEKRYFPLKYWLSLKLLLFSPSLFLVAFKCYN
ncbi:glycosyltransferase [Candidatus Saccharibacteria bacterium]|nr:glycosyltransferase [Candidatus Saccharibacteria bacterium]